MKETIRLFIIESVDPMDLLQGRTESQALAEICKIIGHEVAVLNAFSKSDFKKLCGYISSINSRHDRNKRTDVPLCIHISSHGNANGLRFGKDPVGWKELLRTMKPIYNEMGEYDGKIVLIISACGAGEQDLSVEFEQEWKNDSKFTPPKYIFVTKDKKVAWDDALVSWAMFYHQLPRANLNDKKSVQKILDKIRLSDTGNLKYFRWNEKEEGYLSYSCRLTNKHLTRRVQRTPVNSRR